MPLLFYALDYKGDFKVYFNEKEIALGTIPDNYQGIAGTFIKDFTYFYYDSVMGRAEVELDESPGSSILIFLSDLHYFETDMPVGEHRIKVCYTAKRWTDKTEWVKKYSFRYALSPAKYWKSFGTLHITIEAGNLPKGIITNLGKPTSGSLDSTANWIFNKLPVEIFDLEYEPEISATASLMLKLGPGWLCVLFSLFLTAIHIYGILHYRRANKDVRFSWIMITGSMLVPFLALISYILFFGLIDSLIGEHSSGAHGYTFLVILFYPFITPLYWILMWLVDRIYRRKIVLA